MKFFWAIAITALGFLGSSASAKKCMGSEDIRSAIESNDIVCVDFFAKRLDLSKNIRVPHDPKRLANWSSRMTPLAYAARLGRTSVVEALIQAGARVNDLSYIAHSPMTVAAFFGQPKSILVLLEYGADIDIAPSYRSGVGTKQVGTPLSQAVSALEYNTARTLLASGANPNLMSDKQLPLSRATPSVDMLKLLIDWGADPVGVDSYGNTALHSCYNSKCAELLLLVGTPINHKNNIGRTALDYAERISGEYATYLITMGAKNGSDLP